MRVEGGGVVVEDGIAVVGESDVCFGFAEAVDEMMDSTCEVMLVSSGLSDEVADRDVNCFWVVESGEGSDEGGVVEIGFGAWVVR